MLWKVQLLYNWKLSVRELYLYKNESFLILYSELTLLIFAIQIYLKLKIYYTILIYLYVLYIVIDIYFKNMVHYTCFLWNYLKNFNSNTFYYFLVYIMYHVIYLYKIWYLNWKKLNKIYNIYNSIKTEMHARLFAITCL